MLSKRSAACCCVLRLDPHRFSFVSSQPLEIAHMSSASHFWPEIMEDSSSSAIVYIPVPIPSALFCSKCADPTTQQGTRKRPQGHFAGRKPNNSFVEHLRGCHRLLVQAHFRCRLCAEVFPGLRQANSHVTKSHSAASVSRLQSVPPADISDCGSAHAAQVGLGSHLQRSPAVPQTNNAAVPTAVSGTCLVSPQAAPSTDAVQAASPLLELTASHLLGALAEDVDAASLPSSPRALSSITEPEVRVAPGTWPQPLVVEPSPPQPQLSIVTCPRSYPEQSAPLPLPSAFEVAESQEDLDEAMSRFLVDCSAHNKVRPPSTFSPSRRSPPDIASLPPVAVQRFYNRSRKRSFQQITGHKSPSLNIPINTLGDALRDSMGTIRHHSAQEILVRDEMPDDITGEPVDPEEVVARLTKAASSAPSPLDRLTYQHLKRFDAEGKVLAALFTACLRTGLIPSQWRSYVTILLYKRPKEPTDQEAANPKNWRPIALLPTISKVLTGILADRLSSWASRVAAISPSQKGCYKGEGCFEHIHIMNALKSLSSASKPVHVAFLDLADAFTSVPHDLIFDTLRARSVSNACIDILRSLYTNTTPVLLLLTLQGTRRQSTSTRG